MYDIVKDFPSGIAFSSALLNAKGSICILSMPGYSFTSIEDIFPVLRERASYPFS